MKPLLISALMLLSAFGFGQAQKKSQTINEPQFVFSGSIEYTSFYQGGIWRDDQHLTQYPVANETFYVVELNDLNSIPVVVKEIKTDKDGAFTCRLPAGTYGIVAATDTSNLKKGQFLPGDFFSQDAHEMYSSGWTTNGNEAFNVNANSGTGVLILNMRRTSCMKCP